MTSQLRVKIWESLSLCSVLKRLHVIIVALLFGLHFNVANYRYTNIVGVKACLLVLENFHVVNCSQFCVEDKQDQNSTQTDSKQWKKLIPLYNIMFLNSDQIFFFHGKKISDLCHNKGILVSHRQRTQLSAVIDLQWITGNNTRWAILPYYYFVKKN